MVSGAAAEAMGDGSGGGDGSDRIELVAIVLLAAAAVLTAWATFESTKWSGVQADGYSRGGALRTESTRFSTEAGQQVLIDVSLFLGWLNAAQSDIRNGDIEDPASGSVYRPDPGTPSGFLFERLGPRLTPAMMAWLETDPFTNPDAPASPFVSELYSLEAAEMATQLRLDADAAVQEARAANQNSDDYVLAVVMFALVLFFSALASNLKTRPAQVAVVALAMGVLLFGVGTILTLPVEV